METITIDHGTRALLLGYAGRRGESVESTILFLLKKQLQVEGAPVDLAPVKQKLPPIEQPHTHEQFAEWLGVSVETVKRLGRRTPGRITNGTSGRCVRWHIPTYLASLRTR
jgi:hypothetical protein